MVALLLVGLLFTVLVILWFAIGFASYEAKHPRSEADLLDGGEECRNVVLVEVSG